MSDRKPQHPETMPFEAMLNASPLPMVGKMVEAWFKFEADLLAGMQATMSEWMTRQQKAGAAASDVFTRLTECRDPAEFWKVQQQSWADCAQRAAADSSALSATLLEFSRKAAADIEQAGNTVMASAREGATELKQAAASKPGSTKKGD